jgi:hypothetical protein
MGRLPPLWAEGRFWAKPLYGQSICVLDGRVYLGTIEGYLLVEA